MATSPIYGWPEPDNSSLVKNGAADIRALGNAIDTTMGTMVAKTVVDAKGDLIVGTAADTVNRLAVGNSGESIVADSSTSTGLRYQGNFAAGKNKIINGDFSINQRNFTSSTTSGAYNFDRFMTESGGGTVTTSAQTFTPGSAPVSGYEATNFVRVVTSGQSATSDFSIFQQRIEDGRTFANQTVTISFWAKAASGTPSVAAEIRQSLSSGNVFTPAGKTAITTSWARYSLTVAVPSVAGKTIGTSSFIAVDLWTSGGSDYNARTTSLGLQNVTIDFWGVQVEAGSVATAFQTATGTIQGELAACQRYFTRIGGEIAYNFLANAYFDSTTTGFGMVNYSSMRTTPAATFTTASNYAALNVGTAVTACTAISADFYNTKSFRLNFTVGSARTAGQGLIMTSNNTTNGYIDISAEL